MLWLVDSIKHFCLFRKLSVVHHVLPEHSVALNVLSLIASFQNAVQSNYYRPSLLFGLPLAIKVLRAEVSSNKECCPFIGEKQTVALQN